jgi:DNA/RNA-binding domain of Phe-tRNA-synthetase-like protein
VISRRVALRPGPDLATEFPGLEALLFDVEGLRVRATDQPGAAFIDERVSEYRRLYALETLKDEPRLRAYRDFFWRVGVDPTKVRPAAEALLRRVIQGKPFPRINTLVDAYNLASAETRVALAAFDQAKLRGDLRMRRSRPGEMFLGIGMDAPVTLTGMEVVCEDSDRLVAIYPYRDAEASKVTADTRDVRFLVCGVPGIPEDALREAATVAAKMVTGFCGGNAQGPW